MQPLNELPLVVVHTSHPQELHSEMALKHIKTLMPTAHFLLLGLLNETII